MKTTGESVWAHSVNANGLRHRLVDHLRSTGELARGFADRFGAGELAFWLGLLHDVGKGSCAWQLRLLDVEHSGDRVGLDHKSLGASMATGRGCGVFALAIDGHHGGLRSPKALVDRIAGLSGAERERNADAERAVRRLLPELAATEDVAIPQRWFGDELVAEMGLRLVFSALCDADFLDTAAHFNGEAKPEVGEGHDFKRLLARFELRRAELIASRRRSPMDGIRAEVYEACVAAASAEPGMFRLPAATGSGKTISAGGFALHHAARHGLGRVIVAVPFLTITEQNASVYRSLLDDRDEPVVLEHHSQVDLDAGSRWHRLAAENWDAPFVVTTTVRLFEALFGRKPSAMRRIHRLAGAVIVLDEVQALPHRLLVPILDGLRTLVTEFGATVLLASATQPDFWRLSPFKDLPARDVVPEPSLLGAGSHRVRFTWRADPAQSLSEVADEAAGREQAMVVVNTTAAAAAVFDHWRDVVPDGVAWHLSTRMCPAHRRRVLETVRARLVAGERVLLASTQLIEAGVDIDFPVVYRALAPADSLLQAAGRANREGRMAQPGEVIIFDRGDRDQPPSYRTLVNVTRAHFGPGKADLHDPDAMRAYYGMVYDTLNLDEPNHPQHIGQRIQQARRQFDFQSVTDGPADAVTTKRDRKFAFRMIDDDSIAVVTPPAALDAEAEVRDLIERLRASPVPDRLTLRRLQPYTTTIHRTALKKPGVLALLRPILGEVGAPGSLAEWIGTYDANTGIALDPRIEEFLL